MALSRPILLALIGAVLAAVTFFAMSAARRGDDATVATKPAPAKPATANAAGGAAAKPKPKASAPAKAKATQAVDVKVESKGADAKAASKAKAAAASAAGAPAEKAKADTAAPAPRVPAAVQRAIKAKRTVVLFFFQRGSADDAATARAVAGLRGRKSVAVFTAPISRLDQFSEITDEVGVSQAPAVVILGKGGKARLIEGFIDPETLSQEVADSR